MHLRFSVRSISFLLIRRDLVRVFFLLSASAAAAAVFVSDFHFLRCKNVLLFIIFIQNLYSPRCFSVWEFLFDFLMQRNAHIPFICFRMRSRKNEINIGNSSVCYLFADRNTIHPKWMSLIVVVNRFWFSWKFKYFPYECSLKCANIRKSSLIYRRLTKWTFAIFFDIFSCTRSFSDSNICVCYASWLLRSTVG